MLRKLTGLGSVMLTLSLLDVACMSAKDDGARDGGTHGNGVGDSSTSDKDATAGSGGSAGSTASATGGSRTSTGGTTHSGGAAGASTSDAGTSPDSGTSGNSGAPRDSGAASDATTGDSGAGGTSGAPHDSGTGGATANNVLIDPGFEEVTLEPWLSDGPDLVLEQVDPHSGNQHAALENAYTDPSPLDERMTQGANLLAPGTYTFRIWIKKAAGNLTALRVIAEGFNYMDPSEGTELDILQDVSDTYQLFTLTGISVTTAGPDVGSCTVAVAASGDENAKVYLDDASLTKDP